MKFVILITYTGEALKDFADLGQQIERGRGLVEQMGGRIESYHLTAGRYDAVAIVDLPDAPSMGKLTLMYGASGRVRTETMLAFDEQEASEIAASLSG